MKLQNSAALPLEGARIVPIEKRHIAECESFIAAREWSCVYLSERLVAFKSEKTESPPQSPELFMLTEGATEVVGVLFASRRGNVLHCLSRRVLQSKAWQRKLRAFFKGRKAYSIMGEAEANRLLERACGSLFFKKRNFILMRHLRAGDEAALNPRGACAIKAVAMLACGEKDADELLPLQSAYEAEEMGARGAEAESGKVLMRLKGTLRRQTVIACRDWATKRLLGKAGTNAKGMQWNQIGGVYTLPEERGKGVAGLMVRELVRLSAAEGKSCVLFVRPKNKAARRVYAKSGFEECGAFRTATRPKF